MNKLEDKSRSCTLTPNEINQAGQETTNYLPWHWGFPGDPRQLGLLGALWKVIENESLGHKSS